MEAERIVSLAAQIYEEAMKQPSSGTLGTATAPPIGAIAINMVNALANHVEELEARLLELERDQ